MSKEITLSKKHGLNPSLDICFWCGEPKGLALCGRLKGDAEAPKNMVTSLEPCDKCKEQFKLGVQIIEVTDDGSRFENNPRFAIKAEDGKVKWPTGRFVVMRAESIKGGKAGTKMLCDSETMDKIFANHDNSVKSKEDTSKSGEAKTKEDVSKEDAT